MRIWHLSSNRWNSAITEYALSAAMALKMRGHETLFSPLAGSPAEVRARALGLEVAPTATFGFGWAPNAAKVAGVSFKPDVIISYGGPETQLVGGFKARRVRFRGQDVPRGFIADLKTRLGMRAVDRVIVPSVCVESQLAELIDAKTMRLVPLGVDATTFRPVETAPATRPEVVVLGRLDPVKGHEKIIGLMAKVWKTWGDARRPMLHIVGEPANLSESDVRGMIAKHGAANDVKLTVARVENVAALLSGAALGVVPSIGSEIICRVAEEFLLCGTPVVVSGVGSLNEVLFEGAGASYGGRGADEAAAILAKWIKRGDGEGKAKKAERAERARTLFSLEAMGVALEGALD